MTTTGLIFLNAALLAVQIAILAAVPSPLVVTFTALTALCLVWSIWWAITE